MSNFTSNYHDLLDDILTHGYVYKDPNRKGIFRKEVFSYSIEHDLGIGLPIITTKPVWKKGVVGELLWMLRGETNIRYLVENGINIWTKDAYNHDARRNIIDKDILTLSEYTKWVKESDGVLGELGPIYGHQWRNLPDNDQVVRVLQKLSDPDTRFASDLVISAWNPVDLNKMGLKPCHYAMQFQYRFDSGTPFLDLEFSMRSSDVLLGLPFNMAFYGIMVNIFAQLLDMRPGILVYRGAKAHLYNTHFKAAREQLERDPLEYFEPDFDASIELQVKEFRRSIKNDASIQNIREAFNVFIHSIEISDFQFKKYNHFPALTSDTEMLAYDE